MNKKEMILVIVLHRLKEKDTYQVKYITTRKVGVWMYGPFKTHDLRVAWYLRLRNLMKGAMSKANMEMLEGRMKPNMLRC